MLEDAEQTSWPYRLEQTFPGDVSGKSAVTDPADGYLPMYSQEAVKLVEGRSQREVMRLTGLARDTVARAVADETPPRYSRMPAGSKLDPFKNWICERLTGRAAHPPLRIGQRVGPSGKP
jgi:hypothetical protein